MSLSNDAAAAILDQVLSGTTFSAAGSGYAALAANGGSEVSGTGYSRKSLTFDAATDANPSVVEVTSEIDFGTVDSDWTPATVDEVRIYSASSGGTLLYSDTDTAITYADGNRAFIASGLTCSFGSNAVFDSAFCQTIQNWLLRGGSAPSRARYLGLLNSGTELSGGSYSRLDTDTLWGSATVADPSSKSFSGGAEVFIASADFTGSVNELGLFAASTGGSPLITISISSQTIASGNEVTVNPTVTLT